MENKYFNLFDFSNFWKDSRYAKKNYVNDPPTDEMIISIEAELGYKLPGSYIEMMKVHNGGIPVNDCFPAVGIPCCSSGYVQISGIMGIGTDKRYSLCGEFGSLFWINDWEYPNIGVVICNTPSGGHDLIMLDYRKYVENVEPQVVHVDQENGYKITFLAKNFETFIRGLVNCSIFGTSEEDKEQGFKKVLLGKFKVMLSKLLKA